MLSRTARRLETTLLLSRQGLPRPARVTRSFSTPSKSAHAPATATAASLPARDYLPYLHELSPNVSSVSSESTFEVMGTFLNRQLPYTILPPPLPLSEQQNDHFFPDTASQDRVAVLNACLHNLYNVSRARSIFNQLREDVDSSMLHVRVYNAVLIAYLAMAGKDEPQRVWWLGEMWSLFDTMVSAKENILPNSSTYSIMLSAWHRYNPQSSTPVEAPGAIGYPGLLKLIVSDKQNISLLEVIADQAMSSAESTADIVKALTLVALKNKDLATVSALGKAQAIATGRDVSDIPEAMPTMRPVKRAAGDADGPLEGAETVTEMKVPFNIKNLRDNLAQIAYARQLLPEDLQARQKHLELSAHEIAQERHKVEAETLDERGIDSRLQDRVLQSYMFSWHRALRDRLTEITNAAPVMDDEQLGKRRRGVKTQTSTPHQRNPVLDPYLSLVTPDRLSRIAILEVMRLAGSGGIVSGMKTARTLISIGKAVELEFKARVCQDRDIAIPIPTRAIDNLFTLSGYQNLQERRIAAAKQSSDGEAWTAKWSQETRAKVGAVLMEELMDVAYVTRTIQDKKTGEIISEMQHAFQQSYEYVRGTKLGTIMLNPAVAERISKDRLSGAIHPRHLPMVMPPKPWLDLESGGYIYNTSRLMRFKESREQEEYLKAAIKGGNVELVFEGLNVLGNTPWKINKPIFDVVLEVWNSGERVGKIPPAIFDQAEPVAPPNADTDLQARSIHMQRQRQWQLAAANNHSDRCSVNYKIEIARAFIDDKLYFPHNLDFRGRAYPLPPHLNHIGDDLSRGLLLFAESKPLGERGLRWLKIHLANLYGFDKANFNDRIDWVMERLDDVYDSAKNPLAGKRWWMTADDPWQCLATCIELHAALESGDPLAYESCLPVHQDGTCNGLQHYAALGGDAQGAAQVNLSAADKPSDVYTYVGNKVEKLIDIDAAKGDEWAKLLQGKITRKVVKQTVMTTVYGVTFVGARDQIEKQLKDRGDIPEELCWRAASYLAKQVLTCIDDTFSGAKNIQSWLNLCARLISKSISPERFHETAAHELTTIKAREARKKIKRKTVRKAIPLARFKGEQMSSVIWTTSLGLPIVQPYRKIARKQVMTNIQSIYISDPNVPSEVNSVKQASAFPPNFIHSLDATHMMLTSLECSRRGLTFASVHDSYWTHASCIDSMSEVIRDTFIMLHSSNILEKLNEEFHTRYRGFKIPLLDLRKNRSGFVDKLITAGSRIHLTPTQAQGLEEELEGLLCVSENAKSTVDAVHLLSELDKLDSASLTQGLLEDLGSNENAPAAASSDASREKCRKSGWAPEDETSLDNLKNKFVNVTEVFPPLPKKGTFKVEDIKQSEYFFS